MNPRRWRRTPHRAPVLGLHLRLTLFAAVLVLVAVGGTSTVAWWLMDTSADTAARRELDHATEVVVREYESLLENARITAEAIANWPMTAGSTGETTLLTLGQVLPRSPFLRAVFRTHSISRIALLGPDGDIRVEVTSAESTGGGVEWRDLEMVTQALAGVQASGLGRTGADVGALAAVPLLGNQQVLGAVVVVSVLGDTFAENLKTGTGFDTTIYLGDQVTASSQHEPKRDRPAAPQPPPDVLGLVQGSGVSAEWVSRGPQGRVITRYFPLNGSDGTAIGMVSVSTRVAQLFERRTQMLAVFLPAVAGVLAAAFVAAGLAAAGLSRPIRALVGAVERIGEGDLGSPIQVSGRDEVGSLAGAIDDMRRRLLQHAEEQEQLNRLKDQYLFNMAHELKTPLTSLVASVELLAETGPDTSDDERRHLIGMIQRSTSRFQMLVGNLLDLGSLRTGRLKLNPHPTDLRHLVTEVVTTLQPLFASRNQHVSLVIPNPSPVVHVDAPRVQQVLGNLLSNAAKYGPPGDAIALRADHRGDRARIAITDHGPGIPPGDLEQLFTTYFRSAMSREVTPGVGLGLAIAKAVVEAHGGEIGIESAPGAGTTVWVTLPLAIPLAEVPDSVEAPAALTAASVRESV
jgi:signal transduction histidine kinase